jgi:orotidine-5'-phosphate decarboxylase
MKFNEKLDHICLKNNSLLCVGLDIDLGRIPQFLLNSDDPIFLFNQKIIDATKDLVCAYKPNIAFYERYGIYGLQALIQTIEYIPKHIPVILDAKRGDIGHTAAAYAKAAFEVFKADAVTVNPYMGHDSIEPFLQYSDKGIFILCATSNAGFKDIQAWGQEKPLYQHVAGLVKQWDKNHNCGLVVGATNPDELKTIRALVEDMPILIPGVGAQGGDLEKCVQGGINAKGLRAIINASRSVLYGANDEDFEKAAHNNACSIRDEINRYRN